MISPVGTMVAVRCARVIGYTSTTSATQLNKRENKMKLKLTDVQMEQITVTYLDQVHNDLKCELEADKIEPYLEYDDRCDVLRSVIAIETVMRDLMWEDSYICWKSRHGVEL